VYNHDEIDETVVAAKRGVLFDAGIEDGRRIGRPEPLAREVVRRVLSRRRVATAVPACGSVCAETY
jgi:hypothetical protein